MGVEYRANENEGELIEFIVGKSEGNILLGRPKHKSLNNIKREGEFVWTGFVWLWIRKSREP